MHDPRLTFLLGRHVRQPSKVPSPLALPFAVALFVAGLFCIAVGFAEGCS